MTSMKKAMIGAALGAAALLATAGVAHADPTGSKNSLTLPATCGGRTVILVVNSANGQGAGAQNNNTAPFAPAHVVGSNAVFHPTAFNLTFTFTAANGESNSFLKSEHEEERRHLGRVPDQLHDAARQRRQHVRACRDGSRLLQLTSARDGHQRGGHPAALIVRHRSLLPDAGPGEVTPVHVSVENHHSVVLVARWKRSSSFWS
jgi:hypothetical protein